MHLDRLYQLKVSLKSHTGWHLPANIYSSRDKLWPLLNLFWLVGVSNQSRIRPEIDPAETSRILQVNNKLKFELLTVIAQMES